MKLAFKQVDAQRINEKTARKQRIIRVAMGQEKADLVLKNARYVNVFSNELCSGDIAVAEGLIVGMGTYSGKQEVDVTGKIISPGFLDSHIHLESSLVTPQQFARAVLPHGTTTVITDPHEIANVLGQDGISYMLRASEGLPVDVHFMLPSCVPATGFDESGAALSYRELEPFYAEDRVLGLAEMMNYVGVVNGDATAVEKIVAAQSHHKKIDGHAPGLCGNALNAYIAAGVYSDHECDTMENALEKLRKGQFVMIREGTAARNLEALLPLLTPQYASRCMFATDDKHPSDILEKGHINYIVREAVHRGVDPILAIKVGTHNAARYFLLNNKGAIAPGYLADFVVLDDLWNFNVEKVFKRGQCVFDKSVAEFAAPAVPAALLNRVTDTMHLAPVFASDFAVEQQAPVIGMVPGQIVTQNCGMAKQADVRQDILKMAVFERHKNTGNHAVCFCRGYGLQKGAVATSIAHDSHNIICVGCSDSDMAAAVNAVREMHGGIAVVCGTKVLGSMALPIAGLMCDMTLLQANTALEQAKEQAYLLGVNPGIDPFMTLSFMSLPVIPQLRLTTKGVVDAATQQYVGR